MSWGRTVIGFLIGAVIGGALLFGAVGLVGQVSGLNGLTYIVALVALAAAVLLDLLKVTPLGPKRQVNEDWLGRYRDWVVGLGFGAQLGAGFTTYVTTWGTWALVVIAAVAGLPGAILVGVSFGLGRCVLLMATGRSTSTVRLAESMRRFVSAESSARWLALAGYSAVVVIGGVYVA